VRDLKNVKTALKGNQEAWNAVREEAYLKLMRPLEGGATGGERQISGTIMKKIEDAMLQNRDALEVLFSKQELMQMRSFARVVNRVVAPVKGGANFSNTGPAIAKLGQYLAGRHILGARFGDLLSRLPGGATMRELTGLTKVRAAQGALPPKQIPYKGTSAGMAAGLTSSTGE
jgi:hypothetical protein